MWEIPSKSAQRSRRLSSLNVSWTINIIDQMRSGGSCYRLRRMPSVGRKGQNGPLAANITIARKRVFTYVSVVARRCSTPRLSLIRGQVGQAFRHRSLKKTSARNQTIAMVCVVSRCSVGPVMPILVTYSTMTQHPQISVTVLTLSH